MSLARQMECMLKEAEALIERLSLPSARLTPHGRSILQKETAMVEFYKQKLAAAKRINGPKIKINPSSLSH